MTFRRGAVIAALAVVAAVVAALIVYGVSLSRPVADGYTGHAASPTPATPQAITSTGRAGEPTSESHAAPADSSAEAASPSGASTEHARSFAEGDHPSWDPADDASEGADAEPKVPGGLGTEPYRLPAVSERGPALTAVPGAAAADGKLATGFPQTVVPAPDGAEIQTSSVSPQGLRVLVGMHALSDDDPEALLGFYTRHCEDLGWPVTLTQGPADEEQLRCGFGGDSMSVSVRGLPTGRIDVTVTGAFLVPEGN